MRERERERVCVCVCVCVRVSVRMLRILDLCVQPIAFGVSFDLILTSQFNRSLFTGLWHNTYKRHKELDNRMRFEIGASIPANSEPVCTYTSVCVRGCVQEIDKSVRERVCERGCVCVWVCVCVCVCVRVSI